MTIQVGWQALFKKVLMPFPFARFKVTKNRLHLQVSADPCKAVSDCVVVAGFVHELLTLEIAVVRSRALHLVKALTNGGIIFADFTRNAANVLLVRDGHAGQGHDDVKNRNVSSRAHATQDALESGTKYGAA